MLSFKYRIFPSKKQVSRLDEQMDISKILYNLLLDKAKAHYNSTGKTFTKFQMNNWVTKLKQKYPIYRSVHSQVLQNTCDRVSKAYQNFFRRVKEKKKSKSIKVGYPRYKKGIKSLTYPQSGFKFKSDKRLSLSRIGNIPIILHRLPKGKVKTLTIKKYPSGKWFVLFSCETPAEEFKPNSGEKIGLDVGLTKFAVLSNGKEIENPKLLQKSLKRMKRVQRRMSKRKRGSKNRHKQRLKVAKTYEHISNQRSDFLHQISHRLVNKYSLVAVEKLQIKNMIKNHYLARGITDASWSNFVLMLQYKAGRAGCEVVEVNPKNTSQECSGCGQIVKKSLATRVHNCLNCGLKMGRDHNAAINILKRATAGLAESHACGDTVRPSLKARVAETGTILGARSLAA